MDILICVGPIQSPYGMTIISALAGRRGRLRGWYLSHSLWVLRCGYDGVGQEDEGQEGDEARRHVSQWSW